MRCGKIVLSQIFGCLVVAGLHFGLSGEEYGSGRKSGGHMLMDRTSSK